jgi:branched-chain amino acid aminotransferase
LTLPLPPGTRIPDRAAWLNGRLVRGEEAALNLWDRGARDGGGIFETVRVYGGVPFAWVRHLERLVLSAAELGFPVPPSPRRLREAVAELLAAQSLTDAVVRITVTRGVAGGRPTRTGCWIEAEPVGGRLWSGTRAGRGRAVRLPHPFSPGWIGRHKTTSRLAWDLAREYARAEGADEALLVDRDGMLLEGAASNLFVVRDAEVLTPPLTADVLPGIARAVVLEACAAIGMPARECALPAGMLAEASEAFLTNSVQEVLPLGAVGDRVLPATAIGERLRDAYRERVARECGGG